MIIHANVSGNQNEEKMTNIYNKGKYRSGEWAKHLRPFLKRQGNKRWRLSAQNLKNIDYERLEILPPINNSKIKPKKEIEVKFKLKSFGDRTISYSAKYRSLRSAKDAMKRNRVINAKII
jgi:hypothetical protein